MSTAALKDVLDSALRELGAASRGGFFGIALEAVEKIEGGVRPKADILLSPRAAELAHVLREPLGDAVEIITNECAARMSDDMLLPLARIAVIRASELTIPPAIVRLVTHDTDTGARAIFVVDSEADIEALAKALATSAAVEINAVAASALSETIQAWLTTRLMDLQQQARTQSLARIGRVTQAIVGEELRSLELRKQLLSEDIAAERRGNSMGGSPEVLGRIRTVLQRNLQDAERAFKAKYDELNRAKNGEFQAAAATLSSRLDQSDMQLIERASKTETTETEIKAPFVERFVENLDAAMRAKMSDDMAFIDEAQRLSTDQINAMLVGDGYPVMAENTAQPPRPQPELVIKSHFHVIKSYGGEVTKDGPMQYFIALRDYTGMIMVLVGILAPLTLIATSPDASDGSLLAFINQVAPLVKKFRSYLTFFTAILVAWMLIYGFIDLRKRIPRKRIEERMRDLRKAQESLEGEGRRMFSDGARDWVSQISTYLRDVSTDITSSVEQSIRTGTQQAAEAGNEQRRRLAIESNAVDSRLRGVMQIERRLETLVKR